MQPHEALVREIKALPWQFEVNDGFSMATLYAEDLNDAQKELVTRMRRNTLGQQKSGKHTIIEGVIKERLKIRLTQINGWPTRDTQDPTIRAVQELAFEKGRELIPAMLQLPWKAVRSDEPPGYEFAVKYDDMPETQRIVEKSAESLYLLAGIENFGMIDRDARNPVYAAANELWLQVEKHLKSKRVSRLPESSVQRI